MTRYMRSRGYHSVMRSHRYRPILIILLVLLAAFLIFKVAGVGGINESNYEAQTATPAFAAKYSTPSAASIPSAAWAPVPLQPCWAASVSMSTAWRCSTT